MMKAYIQPITEIHGAELSQIIMNSKLDMWDDLGEEGQFSNTFGCEGDKILDAIEQEKWDKF